MENYIEKTSWQENNELNLSKFISKVYAWMCLALVVTGLTSYWVINTVEVLEYIAMNRYSLLMLAGLEMATVWYIGSVINRISANTAMLLFIFFAVLNGVSMSILFLLFTSESIMSTFIITGGTFAIMSAYGYYTKKDLTSWGNLLFMAVIGLMICGLVNMFFQNSFIHFVMCCVGVLVFTCLVAYDTQKIKRMFFIMNQNEETRNKVAIFGALSLYIDFINLFSYLLNLLGDRK